MGSTTYEWILDHEYSDKPPGRVALAVRASVLGVHAPRVGGRPDAAIEFTARRRRRCARPHGGRGGGKNVWIVGGGDLAGQFADAGLLDEVIVYVAPVTLGAGAPLFPSRQELRLEELDRTVTSPARGTRSSRTGPIRLYEKSIRITTRRLPGGSTSRSRPLRRRSGADVQLAPGDVLSRLTSIGYALERTRAALAGEVDGGVRERVADTAAPVPGAVDEAGHGPDGVVGLVLGPAVPVDLEVALQAEVRVRGSTAHQPTGSPSR